MEQFDTLLAETKKLGMYVIMDLVVNHCSNEHAWFKKALSDPDGPSADYFFFRKGKDGLPPSNYRSYFGGSTWEPVPGTDKYYLHFFAKQQPDLNWENPDVRYEIYKMINWWLDKGVAGFRIDAIINIKKDTAFPDYPADGPDGLVRCTKMVDSVQGVGKLLAELRDHTFARYNAFTVGEVFNVPQEKMADFIGDHGYFSTMFDFSAHILSENGLHGWYDAHPVPFSEWKRAVIDSQLSTQEYGFKALIIENHDEPRGASTWLPPYARTVPGIQMLAVKNLLLRGIPFIYQGQELGMQNCSRASIGEYDDISTKNEYEIAMRAGVSKEKALEICCRFSRDNARTPMPWSSETHGGFTDGEPWLALNPSYTAVNVRDEEKDPASVLNFYRRLIALRKNPVYREVFTWGIFKPARFENDSIFAYYRYTERQNILVICNFAADPVHITLPSGTWSVLLGNNAIEFSGNIGGSQTVPSCGAVVLEKVD